MQLSQCATAYLAAKASEHLRQPTITNYTEIISQFCRAHRGIDADALTPDQVREYLHKRLEGGLKDTSTSHHRDVLVTWLRWLASEGYVDRDDWGLRIPTIRCDRGEPVFLTAPDCLRLLAGAKSLGRSEFHCARNLAIVAFLVETGLRRGECLRTNLADLNLTERSVQVSNEGKSRRARVVYFGPSTLRVLRAYLRVRGQMADPTGALWVTQSGHRMSQTRLYNMIKGAARAAGLTHVFPHALRHTCATLLLTGEDALNPVHVKELLGHSSLAVTMRYVHLVSTELKRAYDRKSPLERL